MSRSTALKSALLALAVLLLALPATARAAREWDQAEVMALAQQLERELFLALEAAAYAPDQTTALQQRQRDAAVRVAQRVALDAGKFVSKLRAAQLRKGRVRLASAGYFDVVRSRLHEVLETGGDAHLQQGPREHARAAFALLKQLAQFYED